MKTEKSIKQLMAELEDIVAWFDGDDIDIEQATAKFEQANKLAETIKKQLAEAKNQIRIIKQKIN